MTTMTSPLAALGSRFRFNETLLETVTNEVFERGLDRDTLGWGVTQPIGFSDTFRRRAATCSGCSAKKRSIDGWEASFGMGVKPSADDKYPPVAELIAAFAADGEILANRLASLSDKEASKELPRAFPDGSATLEGAAHYLYMHEAYHIGQLGYLRRMSGLPGFA